MNLRLTDVFDAVGRKAIEPRGGRQGSGKCACIQQDLAFAVAANEMAKADGVVDGGPAMRVDWNGVADGNAGVEYAHSIIFENETMMLRRGDNCVKLGGIRPGSLGHGRVR